MVLRVDDFLLADNLSEQIIEGADALGDGSWPLTLVAEGEGGVLLAARCSLVH